MHYIYSASLNCTFYSILL